jgi:hypothetical protein
MRCGARSPSLSPSSPRTAPISTGSDARMLIDGTGKARKSWTNPGSSCRAQARRSGVLSATTVRVPRAIAGPRNCATLVSPLPVRPACTIEARSSRKRMSPVSSSSSISSRARASHCPTYIMPEMNRFPSTRQTSRRRPCLRLWPSSRRQNSSTIALLPTPGGPTSTTAAPSRVARSFTSPSTSPSRPKARPRFPSSAPCDRLRPTCRSTCAVNRAMRRFSSACCAVGGSGAGASGSSSSGSCGSPFAGSSLFFRAISFRAPGCVCGRIVGAIASTSSSSSRSRRRQCQGSSVR